MDNQIKPNKGMNFALKLKSGFYVICAFIFLALVSLDKGHKKESFKNQAYFKSSYLAQKYNDERQEKALW